MVTKQLKLGIFFQFPGQHVAAWRHPNTRSDIFNLEYFKELAKTAERGKFDMIFFADLFGYEPSKYQANYNFKVDPTVLVASLAAVTQNIGLTATATTTYNEPFQIARRYAGIDHLSNGRVAWNVVTSANPDEAKLFGKTQHLSHKDRYARAEEFVEVTKKLWLSVGEKGIVADKEKGIYIDESQFNRVQHKGEWFEVDGYLDIPATPQGHPVIIQAGSSEAGKELAAKTAEVVFTAWQTVEEGQAFYSDLKGRLTKYGRTKDDLKIMPGAYIIVGETEEAAFAKKRYYDELITPEIGLDYLSEHFGFDLSGEDVNAPIPEKYYVVDETDPQIGPKIVNDLIQRNGLKTLKDLYEFIGGGRRHLEIIGSAQQVADVLEKWLVLEAADGFNILPPIFPDDLEDITNLLIPELQRRGLFRTEYEGTTLRDNLGLKKPTLQQLTTVR